MRGNVPIGIADIRGVRTEMSPDIVRSVAAVWNLDIGMNTNIRTLTTTIGNRRSSVRAIATSAPSPNLIKKEVQIKS